MGVRHMECRRFESGLNCYFGQYRLLVFTITAHFYVFPSDIASDGETS